MISSRICLVLICALVFLARDTQAVRVNSGPLCLSRGSCGSSYAPACCKGYSCMDLSTGVSCGLRNHKTYNCYCMPLFK